MSQSIRFGWIRYEEMKALEDSLGPIRDTPRPKSVKVTIHATEIPNSVMIRIENLD